MADEAGAQDVSQGFLRWRCRRGMRELDLLLCRWLDRGWATADASRRAAFLRLLEEPDPQLVDWLLNGERPADQTAACLLDDIVSR
ncbi:MAG: succinate dehydrogenase assembly factor 2 [Steroidobacteraceae bacterium]